tara:strand:- start:583 stop:1032 length:450 start_codon:yes stop_codon:yes gene_type:complete
MANEVASRPSSEDRIRREKLKKMLDSMSGEKMAQLENYAINQSGPGPGQYAISGDYDPYEIYGEQRGDTSGSASASLYAQGLVAAANTAGDKPPEQFWFEGRMYRLIYTMEAGRQAPLPKGPPARPGKGSVPQQSPDQAVLDTVEEIVF